MDNNNENLNKESAANEKLETQAEILESEIEISENLDKIKEEEIKEEGKLFRGVKVILSGIIDQILAVGLAMIVFGILTLVLKLFGYRIDMKDEMFLIVYIICNVLYYPLIQELLSGKTLGKKIMFR